MRTRHSLLAAHLIRTNAALFMFKCVRNRPVCLFTSICVHLASSVCISFCIWCSLHFVLLCVGYTADPNLREHEDSPHSESRINNDAQKSWRRARQKSDTSSKANAFSAYSSPILIINMETLLRITARTNEPVATNASSPKS